MFLKKMAVILILTIVLVSWIFAFLGAVDALFSTQWSRKGAATGLVIAKAASMAGEGIAYFCVWVIGLVVASIMWIARLIFRKR